MGKELEGCKWSKPDGENPHFRTQATRLSACRWRCSEEGVQGHRAGRDLGSAQRLCPSVVRKSLDGGWALREGGDLAIRDICFQQPHEYPKVIFLWKSEFLEV